jgi:hypothetical protein
VAEPLGPVGPIIEIPEGPVGPVFEFSIVESFECPSIHSVNGDFVGQLILKFIFIIYIFCF